MIKTDTLLDYQKKMTRAVVIAVIAAILGGCAIGFAMGYRYCAITRFPCVSKGPLEYTVLDNDRVITSVGDTITYQWQVKALTLK